PRVSGYHQCKMVLDEQILFNRDQSLLGMALWVGLSDEELRVEWKKQVEAQTKSLDRQDKNAGKKAVEVVLELGRSISHVDDNLAELDMKMATTNGIEALTEYNTQRYALWTTRKRLSECRVAAMNKLAVNEQNLEKHIGAAMAKHQGTISTYARKYNVMCKEMQSLITKGQAPKNVIAPLEIKLEGLFKMDIDHSIWHDLGFNEADMELELCKARILDILIKWGPQLRTIETAYDMLEVWGPAWEAEFDRRRALYTNSVTGKGKGKGKAVEVKGDNVEEGQREMTAEMFDDAAADNEDAYEGEEHDAEVIEIIEVGGELDGYMEKKDSLMIPSIPIESWLYPERGEVQPKRVRAS
ncbi:hypothetical protein EUX98_g7092, partial [Antrodiella citrinella]